MSKIFLFDIEGTTTDINFVHKVLFPYSLENISSFITNNFSNEIVKKSINDVVCTVLNEEKRPINQNEAILYLQKWIRDDRKHSALKEIQGLIWDDGYKKAHFKGHVYEDVPPCFKRIIERKDKIAIYSSGSVHAQKLIFGFSIFGDLTPYISHYFDTKVGAKREVESYKNISNLLNEKSSNITFYSDIPQELEAAKLAGLNVKHVLRPGTAKSEFESVENFDFL